jgi:tetratricopeptide (TPR) repeat protein
VKTITDLDSVITPTTDGEIAIINLESARRRSWTRFFADPARDGAADIVVEHEQLALQFVGDVSALDRVEAMAAQLGRIDAQSARGSLIQAQVASMAHRFTDARHHLAQAEIGGVPAADVDRLRLNIDQACGSNLDSVLDARRRAAAETGGVEDVVALGSLLADIRDFDAADRAYRQALQAYRDVSPFPIARICFQLGMLWGELVHEPDPAAAAEWYEKALERLPSYTKARVHLAEIYLSCGRADDAESVLVPSHSTDDPEVHWRRADIMAVQGKDNDAQMQAARLGFDLVLERHPLAFADHGSEFYAGSGNDCRRALALALVNVANRPTLRAFEQAHEMALSAGDANTAASLLGKAAERWGNTAGFNSSALAGGRLARREGAAA